MRSTVKKVSGVEIKLTLTREELLHLEAAADAYTDMKGADAAELMGMHDKEFDSKLAHEIWQRLTDIRDEVLL